MLLMPVTDIMEGFAGREDFVGKFVEVAVYKVVGGLQAEPDEV
jgi:hypothetical protein